MAELIEIKNLKKYFHSAKGTVHAVDDVTMDIMQGETMGGGSVNPDVENPRWAEPCSGFWTVTAEVLCLTEKTSQG